MENNAFNPIQRCNQHRVKRIGITPALTSGLRNDFIPIVELDKTFSENGFLYERGEKVLPLRPYIENWMHRLNIVRFDGTDEIVVRFLVSQGNSAAGERRGRIRAVGRGVTIMSQSEFNMKIGWRFLLRLSSKDIEKGAFIDFFADGNHRRRTVGDVHCGRVMIEKKASIIFPLLVKPLNDRNSSLHPNRYWGANARTNSATFGSGRNSGQRRHAGRDLYGVELETSIVAICDGVVLGRNPFFNQTDEVVILHTTDDGRKFIIRYTEVDPNSITVRVGEEVKQGQEIAKIGALTPSITIDSRITNMLHIEQYSGSAGFNLRSPLTNRNASNLYLRRADIVDPLDILIEGYNNTFNIR